MTEELTLETNVKSLNSSVSLPGLDYTNVSWKLVKQINPVYLSITENRIKRIEMYFFFKFRIYI